MHEIKSYEEWFREDVKGPKKIVYLASFLVAGVSIICGAVLFVIFAIATREQRLGTLLNDIGLAGFVSFSVAPLSYVVHDITDTILTTDYRKYVFEKLYGNSILFG